MSKKEACRFVRNKIAAMATPLFNDLKRGAGLTADEAIVLWHTEFERLPQRDICTKLNITGADPQRRIRRLYDSTIEKIYKWYTKGQA